MATVAGGAMSVGTIAVKEAYNCFKPHFDYVCDLDENYENMSAMKITNQCRNWFLKVRRTKWKTEDLKQRYKKANKCLCGIKSIIDTTKEVVKLKTDMNKLKQHDNVMTTRPPPVATNIVELNSLTNNKNDNVRKIQEDLLRQLKLHVNGSVSRKEVGGIISKILENKE
ncbi:hypothetical protein CsSME_00034568 [Camellia sinensis var. sinensis]